MNERIKYFVDRFIDDGFITFAHGIMDADNCIKRLDEISRATESEKLVNNVKRLDHALTIYQRASKMYHATQDRAYQMEMRTFDQIMTETFHDIVGITKTMTATSTAKFETK